MMALKTVDIFLISNIYDFRSSHSTADLFRVEVERIVTAFSIYGATWAVVADIIKGFR